MRPLSGERARPGVTGVLLLVSLLATAVLALQAHTAVRDHRALAEQALRDFARLAAGELVRRATAHVGYDGYAPLIGALGRRLPASELPADLPAQLAADGDARLAHAAGLARRVLVADPGAGTVSFAPDAPSPAVRARLLAQLATLRPAGGPFVVANLVVDDRPLIFVLARAHDPGAATVVGFEVDLGQLERWLADVMRAGPLLPGFVAARDVGNESLFVVVRDQGGVERLRAGEAQPAKLGAEIPFGAVYAGVLEGWTASVSVDPRAAGRLVVGGLPRSPVPLLLGLMALSTGLVVIALLQLRRERALQRLRDEFVAGVSHELRTPLTQIRMFAETLMLDRVRSDEERARALEIIDREARRLAHLVENVLLFSRAERGAVTLAPTAQPLAPLVREVLESFEPVLAGAGVRLETALDDDARASVDPDALRQILLNLLDNAVKYGPRGQALRVGLQGGPRAVRLTVEDEGPGVPPAERRRVFERFRRLERDRRSTVAGAGIGLAVVRDLALRHGGRALVEEGERGGARFVVELPS